MIYWSGKRKRIITPVFAHGRRIMSVAKRTVVSKHHMKPMRPKTGWRTSSKRQLMMYARNIRIVSDGIRRNRAGSIRRNNLVQPRSVHRRTKIQQVRRKDASAKEGNQHRALFADPKTEILDAQLKQSVAQKPAKDFRFFWPELWTHVFVLSIRPRRRHEFHLRLGELLAITTDIHGTIGYDINVNEWIRQNLIIPSNPLHRGQYGAYHSHVRIWEEIIQKGIKYAAVFEDDFDIRVGEYFSSRIKQAYNELQSFPFHVVWLGSHPFTDSDNDRIRVSSCLTKPIACCGAFAYVISLEGAKLLRANAYPIRQAVDLYMIEQANLGVIQALRVSPPIAFVSQTHSDTWLIV